MFLFVTHPTNIYLYLFELLCAKHCSGYQGCVGEQKRQKCLSCEGRNVTRTQTKWIVSSLGTLKMHFLVLINLFFLHS